MRYVEFPPDQLCMVTGAEDRMPMTYKEFLDDSVWTVAKWRESEDLARTRNRLIALFDEAFAKERPGVGIADKDYEKWEPLAALRGMQMPPRNVRPISVFTDAAMFASTKEPEWAKAPQPPPSLPGPIEEEPAEEPAR